MGGIFGRYLAQGLDKWKSTWSWSNASGTVDLLECYTPLHVYGYFVQVCINNKLLALPLSLPFVLGPMYAYMLYRHFGAMPCYCSICSSFFHLTNYLYGCCIKTDFKWSYVIRKKCGGFKEIPTPTICKRRARQPGGPAAGVTAWLGPETWGCT